MKNKVPIHKVLYLVTLCLLTSTFQYPAQALDKKSSLCRSLLIETKQIDSKGLKLFNQYSKDYKKARESKTLIDNISQTRALLELTENDRSLFLRALESTKCFTKTEVLNLKEALLNIESDAKTIKSWLDAQIGIPGKNYYPKYIKFMDYVTKPSAWHHCEKLDKRYKNLVCKTYKDRELRWLNSQFIETAEREVTWPTGFINGQVNLIEATERITKYFDQNSKVFSGSGDEAVEFMKRTSYPGLFDFDADPKLSACKEFKELQDKAGPINVKFYVSAEDIKPNSEWMISDGGRGELIVNTKFNGQVFSVPVRLEVNKGDWSDGGATIVRRVAIINGEVYRFSAC